MSLEVCEICIQKEAKLYRCSKCSEELCIHHYRTHKCSDPNLGLRGERSKRLNASITKESWQNHLKTNKKYQIDIKDDLTFIVEFPWYPFTNLKAWVPATRENYPEEKNYSMNIDLSIEKIANDLNPEEYPQKFLSSKWLYGKAKSWRISWHDASNYWSKTASQRVTKFELLFPQYAQEDSLKLEKLGVKLNISTRMKNLLHAKEKTAYDDLNITIHNFQDHLIINWTKKTDQWARSIIELFIEFMAVFYLESANNWRWIVSLEQKGDHEIEVPFWSRSRALLFWYAFFHELNSNKVSPIHINIINKDDNFPAWKMIKPKQNYQLRPYQTKAIKTWKENNYFGSEELPTGAGKTLIGMDAIFQSQTPTLILVPNLDLVEQWKERIKTFLGISEKEIGIFSGLRKAFEEYDIVISTYQLLSQYIKDYYLGMADQGGEIKKLYDTKIIHVKTDNKNFDTITINDSNNDEEEENEITVVNELSYFDEMQLSQVNSSSSFRDLSVVSKTLDVFRSKFGLLIADECHHVQAETFKEIALHLEIPKRLALSATIEWTFNTGLILATMGPLIYEVRYGRLSKEKYIAPIIYRQIFIRLTVEEQKLLTNTKSPSRSFKSKISRHAQNKLKAIKEIVTAPFTSQILIFTSRVNHAKEINNYLRESGITSTLLVGDVITNNREREEILDKFRKEEIKILILVKMLNEGFDAPCDTVIIASGSKNTREHIQRIGRATRPGRTAKIFELIIDPQDLNVEWEISKQRDVKNVIEPWVQDSLVEKTFLERITKTFKGNQNEFYMKAY
ncbi:MAG: DEAD/DEAH box helicase family protein [Candidatus Thorarchaeota archaeon]